MEAARIPARLLGLATMAEISNICYGNYSTNVQLHSLVYGKQKQKRVETSEKKSSKKN